MKTVQWVLIGSRIFALTCGLTVLGSGCGGGSTESQPTLSEAEKQTNEDTRKAMEAASQQSKAAKAKAKKK